MARSLWKGMISFGLVSIPVELHPAEERREFKFSMLDKRDLSPVGYKRFNKRNGKEVEWGNIVKGYEYGKDRYVVLSDEDFKRANVKASRSIDIETFVPADDISPEYFETPYYLVPSPRAEKVYALLRDTLKATGRVAIAQFVLRTTQHLVAIRAVDRALMLFVLRYADELRGAKGLDLPAENAKGAASSKEIDLAKRLIDDMTGQWKPAAFKHTYHDDLMKRIKEKIRKGQAREITQPEKEEKAEPRSNVIDLAALLRKSLGEKGPAEHGSSARAHRTVRHGTAGGAAHKARKSAVARNARTRAKPERTGLHAVSGRSASSRARRAA